MRAPTQPGNVGGHNNSLLPQHDPATRELVAMVGNWQVRQFPATDPRVLYGKSHGLLHIQLWQPTRQHSILTPSRLTGGYDRCGTIDTTDLTRAVEQARVMDQLHTIMSSPVATIDVEQSVTTGAERLDRDHFTGLVVTENDWPVGVFTQEEAIATRDLPTTVTIGTVLDPALVCLPAEAALHRAAAQCARMGVRRIVVSRHRDFIGVVSGLDFARVVANG